MRHLLYIFFSCYFLQACQTDLPESDSPMLVIEGYIEAGGAPVVIVTTPLNITSSEQSFEELRNHVLNWAVVRVACEEDTVTLTGKYHKGYFPPYVYTTSDLKGEVGKVYTLLVSYRDMEITATTSIPEIPDVSDFRLTPSAQNDTLYEMHVRFIDQTNQHNYYAAFSRVGATTRQYTLSHLGLLDDIGLSHSQPTDFTIYRGHSFRKNGFERHFLQGDTVGVKFAQIDAVSYQCLSDFQDLLLFSNNMFFPTDHNLQSNIRGGMGYWCGLGAVNYYFIVE